MEHLQLLLHLLMLMVGTGSAVYLSTLIRKADHRFLRYLLWHVLAFTATILIFMIFTYVNLNLLDPGKDPDHPQLLPLGRDQPHVARLDLIVDLVLLLGNKLSSY